MELNANNIAFRYDRDWILENVNFSLKSGQRIGLFAPSGYGKSTFAKLLSGYLEPTRGSVTLDGRPLPKSGVCPVQLIWQHPEKAVNPRWRLRQVLEESGAIDDGVLENFGIRREWLNRYPRELSGGELQRFSVSRAVMSGAEFLICDEISTMLDVITQAQLWQEILEVAEKRNMGLLVVTHNLALARRICTEVYDLSQGEFLPLDIQTQSGGTI